MKKLLTGLLATATCFTCLAFAACDDKDKSNLTAAAEYINDLYKDQNKKVRADYDVASKVIIDDVTYTITWSVDVEEGVEVVAGESKTTIDLDETLDADLAYVLTATIKAPNGKTQTVTFNRVVEAAPVMVSAPIEAAPVDGSTYKLYMYQVTTKSDYYFTGTMKGYYLATSKYFDDAVDVKATKVSGSETEFYLSVDDEGTTKYIGAGNSYNNGSWHDNILLEASNEPAQGSVTNFKWTFNATYKTMTIELKGVKAGKDENTTETQDVTYFMGTDSTYSTFGVNPVADIAADDACIGKLVTMVDRTTVAAETKVEQTVRELSAAPVYVGATTIDLAKQGQTYPDVAITWSTESANATIADGVLTLTDPTAAGNVTLTAKVAVGEEEETVEFTFKHIPNTTEAILAAAAELGKGESFGNEVELEGMIIDVPTAYNPDYGNVTVKLAIGMTADTVNQQPAAIMDAYRLAGNSAEDLKLGYTVKVKGIVMNYDGTIQFGQGCEIVGTPVKPAAALIAMIEASMLEMPETVAESGEVELPTAIYEGDTAIVWSVVTDTTAAVISQDGKKITYTTSANGDVTVQIKAVITVGTVTKEETFTVVVKEALPAGVTTSNDDLSTIGAKTSYGAYTSTAGWAVANSQVVAVKSSISSVAEGVFGAVLNGKTSAVGSLTSPSMAKGIYRISFNYAYIFSEGKNCKLKVEIKSASGSVLAETTLSNTTMEKFAINKFTWTPAQPITEACVIVITNLSPSQSSSNKDRTLVWDFVVYSAPQA